VRVRKEVKNMVNNFSICSKLVTLKSILAGLVVFGFFFTACSSSKPEDMLIGKWEAVPNMASSTLGELVEFLKDGTLIRDNKISWKYRILENGNLEVDTGNVAGKFLFEFNVSQQDFICNWLSSAGKACKYRRAQK
jgi:hypothetical protein